MTAPIRTCSHCGYERKPYDLSPPWQCPKCLKSYEIRREIVQKAGEERRRDEGRHSLDVEHPLTRPLKWGLSTLLALLLILGYIAGGKKGKAVPLSDIAPELFKEPIQKKSDKKQFSFRYRSRKYLVQPVADYELWGLVVTHNDITSAFDSYHTKDSVDTKDLCVIWGSNLKSNDFKRMKFWSGSFVCYYQYPQGVRFNQHKFSNNHLITDNPQIRKLIAKVRRGDQVHLKGMLVNYADASYPKGWRRSSTTRLDNGMGACEVMFVNKMEILKRGTPVWYAFDFLVSILFWLTLVARLWLQFFGLTTRIR